MPEEPNYLAHAFKSQYNLIGLGTAVGFAILSGSFLPMLVAAGLELTLLPFAERWARYRRALEENDLPDLLMVDGGKGQLSMAMRALDDLGITDLEVVGIAKSRLQVDAETGARRHSDEKLYRPQRKNAVLFPVNSPALFLLQRVRDEAHRFAVTFHREARSMRDLRSELDAVPGIGPRRRRALLTAFGSLAGVRRATREELDAVVGSKAAAAVIDYFARSA